MPHPLPLLPLLAALALAPAAFAQAPVAHWSFDRIEKNTYPSSGSTPRPATITGTVSSATGRLSQAASFSDSPAGLISIPLDLPTLARDGSFTLEFWLRPMGRSHPYGVCIDAGGSRGFVIRTNNAGRLTYSANNQWNVLSTEFPLDEQVWSHVALVHRGGNATLYLNGRPLGSHPLDPASLPTTLQIGAIPTNLPATDGSSTPPLHHSFVGDIDELKVHARALTAVDVAALAKPPR